MRMSHRTTASLSALVALLSVGLHASPASAADVSVSDVALDAVVALADGSAHATMASGHTNGCTYHGSSSSASQTAFRIPAGVANERLLALVLATKIAPKRVSFKYDPVATKLAGQSVAMCNITYLRISR